MNMGKRIQKVYREVSSLGLGVYAANGAYFLVLAVVPALGLIRNLPGMVAEPVERILGEVLPVGLEGVAGGRSALGIAAVWSASKGLYGLWQGVQVIYGNREHRGWLAGRLLCLGYALAGLSLGMVVLPLALWVIPGGAALALVVQTAAFAGLYLAASRRRKGVLWTAAGASCGCMVLARGYRYVLSFVPRQALYSVAGGLLFVYLWAWTVLLGAVFHAKLWRK